MVAPAQDSIGEAVLERLVACSVDQRLHNVRYRQRQLHLLHQFLRQHSTEICDLIIQESGHTHEESWLELSLTLITINELYEQLDFDDALRREYTVSRNESYINCRAPHGIVLIRPGSYTIFYSILSATAAALAAGNCVAVQTANKPNALISFLTEHFKVLDPDVFAILTAAPEPALLSQCFIVDQADLDGHKSGVLHPEPLPYIIAVVDRTADVTKAAQALCTASFSFKGKSPYSPDLVIVNEWIMEAFLQACIRELGDDPGNLEKVESLLKAGSQSSANGDIIILRNSDSKFVYDTSGNKVAKSPGGSLHVFASTGLIASATTASQYGTLLAGYYFGDTKTCKFLHQSLNAKMACVNNIPLSVLVGPVRPETASSPTHIDLCYNLDFMSKPIPVSVSTSKDANLLPIKASDFGPKGLKLGQQRESLRQLSMQPLRAIQQHSGSGSGFFDQGILTGLVAFVLPSVVALGWIVSQGVKYLWALY